MVTQLTCIFPNYHIVELSHLQIVELMPKVLIVKIKKLILDLVSDP